jgi:hypothetical protein
MSFTRLSGSEMGVDPSVDIVMVFLLSVDAAVFFTSSGEVPLLVSTLS